MTPTRFFYLLQVLFRSQAPMSWDTDWQWLVDNGHIQRGQSSADPAWIPTTTGATFALTAFSKLL